MTNSENIEVCEMIDNLVSITQSPLEFVKLANTSMKQVIAFTVLRKNYDGRVSERAKQWASTQDTSKISYAVESTHVCHINSIAEEYSNNQNEVQK